MSGSVVEASVFRPGQDGLLGCNRDLAGNTVHKQKVAGFERREVVSALLRMFYV